MLPPSGIFGSVRQFLDLFIQQTPMSTKFRYIFHHFVKKIPHLNKTGCLHAQPYFYSNFWLWSVAEGNTICFFLGLVLYTCFTVGSLIARWTNTLVFKGQVFTSSSIQTRLIQTVILICNKQRKTKHLVQDTEDWESGTNHEGLFLPVKKARPTSLESPQMKWHSEQGSMESKQIVDVANSKRHQRRNEI